MMHFLFKGLLVSLLVVVWVSSVVCDCPSGCSSRGLCINNACVCAEGLSGSDCSSSVSSDLPSLFECPTCYTLTVGPARYYSGPSWRLPDGPIVALNYKGTLSMYQGNGDGELIAKGTQIDDWLPAPIVALHGGSPGQFDSCGSWIMRAFTADSGKVLGFYHAESGCTYNNGQTRKSSGYSESADGGLTFTKPNYPYNRVVDTATPFIPGIPSGEGDISVVVRGDYYYLFFANVELYYTGVARAPKSSEGYPGSFLKYNNGQWNSPGVGGTSSRLNNIGGPQAYIHTPSQSIVAVGNFNPYWNQGYMMSVSDDAINWKYFADPIITPDPITNNDQFMYPSFMGPTGGYDIGSKFQFFYMWIPPGHSWTYRYQIFKDVTLSYVGPDNTLPSTKIALTTFISSETGETWQSTEVALPPYAATNIVGYLMSRPYSQSFQVYDCFNYGTNDHFVGTADECFLAGAGIEATRTLGYMWAARADQSVAVYRCYARQDSFLSSDANCEGRGSPQTTPFGYMMSGPSLHSVPDDILIPQGSAWLFYNNSGPASTWNQQNFDDSNWQVGLAPFGSSYAADLIKTHFGPRDYYFRRTFSIPYGRTLIKMLVSVASDNYAIVYINGVLVDSDPATWHEAAYWNRRIFVNTALIVTGTNVIAVVTKNMDTWAFFDLELSAQYTVTLPLDAVACTPGCGAHGQCSSGNCVCDSGWSGSGCATSLCSFSGLSTQVVIAAGASFRHIQWNVVSTTPASWFTLAYDDSWWQLASAPFATISYADRTTTIAGLRHLYRKKFTIVVPNNMVIASAVLSVASDDTHRVFVNGKFFGAPLYPYSGHFAEYWNDVITIAGGFLNAGENVLAVEVPLIDGRWTAYFDTKLEVTFATKTCTFSSGGASVPATPPVAESAPAPAPASSAVKLNLYLTTSVWWFAASITGTNAQITKVEIKDSGAVSVFAEMIAMSWGNVFTYTPSGVPLSLPITVRATSSTGTTFNFIVTSLTSGPISQS